jgi:ParB-like chromosome segregation protein Spo0J
MWRLGAAPVANPSTMLDETLQLPLVVPPTKFSARGSRTPTIYLTLEKIFVEDGFNLRKEMGDIDALAESLKDPKNPQVVKILEHFTVRLVNGTYYLENGHRRYAALKKLQKDGYTISAIPCHLIEGETSELERTYNQLIRNGGKSLTPLETADGISKLLKAGESHETIRRRLGLSETAMQDLKKLYEAPAFVRNMVHDGRLTSYLAITFVRYFPTLSALQPILTRADAAAQQAALKKRKNREVQSLAQEALGEPPPKAAYKILPKHSPELLAKMTASKRPALADRQQDFIPSVSSIRERFKALPKGAKNNEKLKTLSLVLRALEGDLTTDELFQQLGVAAGKKGKKK